MDTDHLPPFITFLLNPASYPHPAADVKLVQTHISYVLLAGDYVYKFKKPVDFGFLDFTSLEKRRYYCGQELLLNRRLCPSLYLGLVTVRREESEFILQEGTDGPGEAVEFGVKMTRMPEERMMTNIIRAGQLTGAMIDSISDVLVPFYSRADGSEEIMKFGTARAVSVNVLENFTQTEQFVDTDALSGKQYAVITDYAKNFLTQESLFAERIAQGRVRDCHGDLYSANICLADQVYIYDCIEFNQRFRYCDVASDVAFLAMDLDFHGLADLSHRFIDRFSKAARDRGLVTMLNFYKCYRAYVRGKIGMFTASAPEVDRMTKEKCLQQAKNYFALAERYAAG
jgi:aminoglycoside phosphotransferase family enzyme